MEQCRIVLLEARARELLLRGKAKAEAKASARIVRKARRPKRRPVTLSRPEADVIYAWTGRSPPDGGWRSATGASIFCSGDLRIGVIVQSNSAIAGSPRNAPQGSLAGGKWWGRALIIGRGLERAHLIVKPRIYHYLRRRESGSTG